MINLMKINMLFQEQFAGLSVKLQADHITVFSFICETRSAEEMTLKDLQQSLSMAQAKMHRVAAALSEAGLIETFKCNQDARMVRVNLSEKGFALEKEISALLSNDALETISELKSKVSKVADRVKEESLMRKNLNNLLGGFSSQRQDITQALKGRGETFVEVGRLYARTSRGIVTSRVLLKRAEASNIDQLIDFIRNESEENYNKLMTPTKRRKGQRASIEIRELESENDE